MNSGRRALVGAGFALLPLLVGGCNDDGQEPGNVLVYELRGALQCTSDGKSPEQSAATLTGAGIDVLRSTCGYRTGVYHPTVCGAQTNDILVHEIRDTNLPHAEEAGFEAVSTLVDEAAGTGYQLIDCSERPPVPVS